MKHWLIFMAGTGLGGAARFLLSAHPWGLLIANIVGCFIIGIGHARGLSSEHRILLMTGFCGALTTLSGLVLDSASLWESGRILAALGYALGTLAIGVSAFLLGRAL